LLLRFSKQVAELMAQGKHERSLSFVLQILQN
jgi:hypothetical protein